MSSNIKLLIACHKPSELPRNNLFLPIRVGAALAKDDFGLQRDDEGNDNISDKNPEYCELTAIYWAWKNLDADYYGLFHYRRFYSFADKRFPTSDDGHMMIRCRILTQDVFEKYALNDEVKMRKIIESNDLIVHESRPVYNLPTPRGIQGKTVYEHYMHHDGTIIRKSDIDEMIEVISSKYPKIYPLFMDYMRGTKFLGYNMFIMKKKLFDEMCSFTFGVLSEMEKKISDSLPVRSMNGNRIYGYLAEILTSAYIYYIRKTNPDLKVQEKQMIYALKTDPIEKLAPVEGRIPIIIDATTNMTQHIGYYLENTLRQLVESCMASQSKYSIIIAYDKGISKQLLREYRDYSNDKVDIKLFNYGDTLDVFREVYGINNIGLKLALPWALPEFDNAIVLSWNLWVKGSLDQLWNLKNDKVCICAAQNVLSIGATLEINNMCRDSVFSKLQRISKVAVNKYFDSSVMIMNLKKIRKDYTFSDITAKHKEMQGEYTDRDIMNAIYCESVSMIEQKWNYQIAMDDRVNYLGSFFAPIDVYKTWRSISNSYCIGKFSESMIAHPSCSDFVIGFYKEMSKSKLWPVFLVCDIPSKNGVYVPRLRERIIPEGSVRRKVVYKMLPPNSRRRKAIVNLYRMIAGR